MAEENIHQKLREIFPDQSRIKWQQTASQEIEGKDPFVELAWNNEDGLSNLPYYDQTGVAQLSYLQNFFPLADEKFFLGNRQWMNCPPVSVDEEHIANKIALEHLNTGADGIFFTVRRECEFKTLLNDIDARYCSLLFRVNNRFDLQTLIRFLEQNGSNDVNAAIFRDHFEKNNLNENFFPGLRSLGISVSRSTAANEVASALTAAVDILKITPDTLAEKTFNAFAFSFPSDKNIFSSVCKLRAFRVLWHQVISSYGMREKASTPFVHVNCEPIIAQPYEPHGNMIYSTLASVSAILGGCDAITVHAQDESNATMTRIARNVSTILRQESHLEKVANPVDGSYALDAMTNMLAEKSWSIFQSLVKK